ncbi:MAG TPA: type II secretion system protein, partial [Verrucomicrobiae bacterium]
ANDNGDKFPWEVSTNDGGSREFIGLRQTFRHFQAASDQIGTPKVVVCEKDSGRTAAMDWGPSFGTNNLSYFVGLDAMQTNAQMILSGDRNLTVNGKSFSGVVSLSTNSMAGWARFIHGGFGNVGLADGSVQQVSPNALRLQVQNAGQQTFRIEFP